MKLKKILNIFVSMVKRFNMRDYKLYLKDILEAIRRINIKILGISRV